ncbi:hypothetical protein P3T23_007478 [Paraburkholderia sp. GAS448]
MSKLKSLEALFDGRRFDREIIILCVRWYLRYKLSLRDLVEMMAERGLSLAHTTILRWVRRSTQQSLQNHLYGRKANECSNTGVCTFWRDVGRHQLGRCLTSGKKAAVAYGEGGTGRSP